MIKKAHAKLNLAIDILGVREDGYHDVDMVTLPLEMHDCLEISELLANKGTFITADDVTLFCDDTNSVHKAFNLMDKHFNIKRSYRIQIYKNIPTQAGLAGGSADAACLMNALVKERKLNTSLDELASLSLSIGADIPFCIYNKPARVNGIGEKLTPITSNINLHVLLVKPKQGLSTKKVYELSDTISQDRKPDIEGLINILKSNPTEEQIAPYLYNGLRNAATHLCPEIEVILTKLKEKGLVACEMSGSGSCCFALSKDLKKLEKISKEFSKQGYETYITNFLPTSKK